MARKPRSPFAGFPATRQDAGRDGLPVFTVVPRALTPLRAKLTDGLGGLTAVALFFGGLYGLSHLPDATGWHWTVVLIAPWPGYQAAKALWRVLLRRQTTIVMSADEFRVRTWAGWKIFDRHLPHKFAAVQHDKARAERERHELEIRKAQAAGKIIGKTRYYGESWHISFEYLDQRNDVMTVYGQKEARAIRDRLKAVDEVLNAAARKGDGTALRPEQEWSEQPGDIPETP